MNVYVITGVSRGIGKALVNNLARNDDNKIYGLSRSFLENKNNFKAVSFDLSNPDLTILENLWNEISSLNFKKIYLINNAGVIEPIKKIGKCHPEDLKNNISVNLIAPLILINSFLNFFENLQYKKVIANISSGSAYTPFGGWAAYCASKAGLDMITKAIALEAHDNLKIFSIAPGIVETQMQEKIRQSDKNDFEFVDKFIEFKDKGYLYSANFAAEKIIKIIHDKNTVNGSVLDIRDF